MGKSPLVGLEGTDMGLGGQRGWAWTDASSGVRRKGRGLGSSGPMMMWKRLQWTRLHRALGSWSEFGFWPKTTGRVCEEEVHDNSACYMENSLGEKGKWEVIGVWTEVIIAEVLRSNWEQLIHLHLSWDLKNQQPNNWAPGSMTSLCRQNTWHNAWHDVY